MLGIHSYDKSTSCWLLKLFTVNFVVVLLYHRRLNHVLISWHAAFNSNWILGHCLIHRSSFHLGGVRPSQQVAWLDCFLAVCLLCSVNLLCLLHLAYQTPGDLFVTSDRDIEDYCYRFFKWCMMIMILSKNLMCLCLLPVTRAFFGNSTTSFYRVQFCIRDDKLGWFLKFLSTYIGGFWLEVGARGQFSLKSSER